MTNYQHLILTPFNQAYGGPFLSDEWLEERFDIFKKVTYASMMAQSNMDYIWIVAFDHRTPEKWRKVQRTFKHIFPIYTSATLWSDVVKQIKLPLTGSHVVSTRLDSDDAFREDTIDVIQHSVDLVRRRFYSFRKGYITDGKTRLIELNYITNAFLTLVESLDQSRDVETARCIGHGHAASGDLDRFQEIQSENPAWLIYAHGSNIGNTIEHLGPRCSTRRKTSPSELDVFNVDLPIRRK